MVRAIARSAGALSARVFGVAGVSAEPRFQKAVEKPAIGAGVAMSVNKHWYRLDEKNADGLAAWCLLGFRNAQACRHWLRKNKPSLKPGKHWRRMGNGARSPLQINVPECNNFLSGVKR